MLSFSLFFQKTLYHIYRLCITFLVIVKKFIIQLMSDGHSYLHHSSTVFQHLYAYGQL